MPEQGRSENGPKRDTSVSSLMYTEDKSELLWLAHERSHELEQKALTVALTANDARLQNIQDYIVKYIDSELRKVVADNLNLIEQIKKDWSHHNEVHSAHGVAHEREHRQTQDAIDKSEKTALTLSNTLSADVQRTILAQAGLVTKDQLIAEMKAMDARVALLERNTSTITGQTAGANQLWILITSIVFVALAVGGFIITILR